MGNDIANASGLDDMASWIGSTGVDEATIGGPGRRVLISSGGDMHSASGPNVVAGQWLEVFGHHAATGGNSSLRVLVGSSGVVVPLKRAGQGSPRRGVPSSFSFSYGRVQAPATGVAKIRTVGTGTAYLLKPFLSADPPADTRARQCWEPGAHANPDLNLPRWPSELPLPVADSWDAKPVARRKSFSGDSNVPITRRVANSLRAIARFALELDVEQRAVLEEFVLSNAEPFWFTRPDTQQLCRAYWTAEGDPADAGLSRSRRTTLELLLEVS